MDQRCSKNCRSADSCGHSRYTLHFHIRILLSDFKHQPAHTIDSGISAADHSRCLSFFCLFKSHTATLYFLFHRCRQELFSCKMLPHQIYINGISDNDITGFQCFYRTDRHLFIFPRSNSNYIYFFHALYSSISFLYSLCFQQCNCHTVSCLLSANPFRILSFLFFQRSHCRTFTDTGCLFYKIRQRIRSGHL